MWVGMGVGGYRTARRDIVSRLMAEAEALAASWVCSKACPTSPHDQHTSSAAVQVCMWWSGWAGWGALGVLDR
jgi:hypothetical protein